MRARDIMKKEVITVYKEDPIDKIIKILMKNNISGIPVVDENEHVIGMVTEQDLITKEKGLKIPSYIEFLGSILFIDGVKEFNLDLQKALAINVQHIMTSPAYTVQGDATIAEIASIMVNRRINRVPVVDKQNKLIGIIGRGDLLPLLIQQ